MILGKTLLDFNWWNVFIFFLTYVICSWLVFTQETIKLFVLLLFVVLSYFYFQKSWDSTLDVSSKALRSSWENFMDALPRVHSRWLYFLVLKETDTFLRTKDQLWIVLNGSEKGRNKILLRQLRNQFCVNTKSWRFFLMCLSEIDLILIPWRTDCLAWNQLNWLH